jgi:hypothetical protein
LFALSPLPNAAAASQLAEQAKDRGIPEDVINLAFMSNDEMRQEREKVVFDAIDNLGQMIGNELSWKKLGMAARHESMIRVVGFSPSSEKSTDDATIFL